MSNQPDQSRLAIDGGTPVRSKLLSYGRQWVDSADQAAVAEVLQSAWLTTGPKVAEFESAFAAFIGAKEAVAVSNGTAALHTAMHVLDVGPGDEVIVPAMTFAASANCVLYQGGRPVFADVCPDTLLVNPASVEAQVTARTRAIIAVDFAGQACDYNALKAVARRNQLALVADACHAVGGTYRGRNVGTLADLNTFSLHPVKHFTTGEGGMITTDNEHLARRMRAFRNHGITTDHRQRESQGSWYYEMVELGFNYRLTDFQCALGISQLRKLPGWVARRQAIADHYRRAFATSSLVQPLAVRAEVSHAYHLFVIRLRLSEVKADRAAIFRSLRAEGIGANVHYIPVPWHPYYQQLGYAKGQWPVAEKAYEEILSLPIFPAMSDGDVEDVVTAVQKVLRAYQR